MGGDLPVLKPKEVVKILNKLGFTMVRQKGSHQQFRHTDVEQQPYQCIVQETYPHYY